MTHIFLFFILFLKYGTKIAKFATKKKRKKKSQNNIKLDQKPRNCEKKKENLQNYKKTHNVTPISVKLE